MRRVVLVVAALLVIALIAAGLYLLWSGADEVAEAPERSAAERARATPAVSPVVPTDALGSGRVFQGSWYEVAFTAPRYPDDPRRHQGGLDERLVTLIDRATSTLDVAVYDFDLANVAEAMVRAKQRGVRVRMVTDTDTLDNTRDEAIQAAFDRLRRADIPIVDDQRNDIMHHKFVVVDGEWVETGSWNFTDGDTYRLNNNQLIAHSRELAANYAAEFEKMFVQRKFGPSKPAGVPYPRIRIGSARIETYFAPQDQVAQHLIEAINRQTSRSLNFLAFSFTHDGIGGAMLDKARAGVAVQGVFETTGSNTRFSEYTRMREAGLDVYQDGNPWVMHHKVIIMDDRTVAFGSFNFSESADRGNDENLLIVEDPGLAQAFQTEYERVLTVARQAAGQRK